jgi:predicted Rossmann fold flavoprotein
VNDLIIIGGGPAGFFAAISAKAIHPDSSVLILEKSNEFLTKVYVSGNGRCNLTNAECTKADLARYYPRGFRELQSPWTRWPPEKTMQWFRDRSVALKTEDQGKVFPVSNRSQTIIDCLLAEAEKCGIEMRSNQHIESIARKADGFEIHVQGSKPLDCKKLLLATGSHPSGFAWAKKFGHTLRQPVPSLFAFNIENFSLKECSGVSIDPIELRIDGMPFHQCGPLLITHFGFSGPAALCLSAFCARDLSEKQYQADLIVNWLPDRSFDELYGIFRALKMSDPHKTLGAANPFSWPKSFWKTLLGSSLNSPLSTLTLKDLRKFCIRLQSDRYRINGKTASKEEFVTCGGVALEEINFKTMESKVCPNLFFAGEILDVDGITGGFNLQNAWMTGHIAGAST